MQRYRFSSISIRLIILRKAVNADFRWIPHMLRMSASKILFLQSRYNPT